MKKIISRLLIGVIIIALLVTAGGLFYFKSYLPNTLAKQSFPQIDGQIHLDGLNEAEVRDLDLAPKEVRDVDRVETVDHRRLAPVAVAERPDADLELAWRVVGGGPGGWRVDRLVPVPP